MSVTFGVGRETLNGGPVEFEGQPYLCIRDHTTLAPFLMTVASDTDLWMFVSSAGGLTAGRTDPDGALFPYATVDELHDAHHHTGPITLLRVRPAGGAEKLWEPFATRPGASAVEHRLYKHPLGTPLVFEAVHHELGLVFRQRWAACDAFGHVRTAELVNTGARPVTISLLDGVRNVLPFGAPLALYQHSGSLVDAYKRSEVDPVTGLGIFSLTSRISDRAEPAEELRANTVWVHGLPKAEVHLEHEVVDAFRARRDVPPVRRLNGQRGNHLVRAELELAPGARARWTLAADAKRDHRQIAALRERLRAGDGLAGDLERALAGAAENLRRNVASADGLQLTADARTSFHHLANVLYNNMRGGVFADHHQVPAADFAAFLGTRNRPVVARHERWIAALPSRLPVDALLAHAARTGDPDLERLAHEYLPLHFGRRHGDPSRPWNRFTIRVREADGSRALRYEGNWRDIFQNWEALAASFPGFLPSMVAKFVNASTVDGFNPYRITRDGVDWEVEEPGVWSNIGYWGDHQVVYLLRLLEALRETWPGTIEAMLDRAIFSYADVPYRIVPFADMVAHPRKTIVFDHAAAARVARRVEERGTDGRLVAGPDGGVRHVTLLEKLLVTVLARISNLVPGAGIWMNTQRPEWNDANNALVGHGVSVVTLAALRRMLVFLRTLLEARCEARVAVSPEVADWTRAIRATLEAHPSERSSGREGDRERFTTLERLGEAFSRHRERAYTHGLSAPQPFAVRDVLALLDVALAHVDLALRANEREDGLFHAYNLLEFDPDAGTARLERLPEMLEGQVAALGSGLVTPEHAVRMLDQMFASRLYRPDQESFMLYPEKTLPGFLETNVIPEASARAVPLVRALLDAGDESLCVRDAAGVLRFAPGLAGERAVSLALDRLVADPRWREAVERDRAAVEDLYESVFHHHAFTGRSGTMYGYEGIGSIYWHMVAKLLLAVQEMGVRAEREGAPAAVREALARHVDRVRAGLGSEKAAERWGAFPTDPYSHTPAGRGAQQPGMTGQVKEEILTRFGELGVRVEAGRVAFRPRLLHTTEFLAAPAVLETYGHDGAPLALPVPANALAFTYCAVPVVYELADGPGWLRVTRHDGHSTTSASDTLDDETSRALLLRDGAIARIEVGVPARSLRAG